MPPEISGRNKIHYDKDKLDSVRDVYKQDVQSATDRPFSSPTNFTVRNFGKNQNRSTIGSIGGKMGSIGEIAKPGGKQKEYTTNSAISTP